MGWLVIVGVFVGLAAIGGVCLWVERTWKAFFVLLLLLAPIVAFARLAWLVLFTPNPDPSVGEIAFPFVLAVGCIVLLWLWAYSKHPKATSDVTSAAAWTYLGTRAVGGYQRHRDRERAKALADELEKRERER